MYTLNQLLIIDRFGKYIPPIDNDKDGTKDIPHLEDVLRTAKEKGMLFDVSKQCLSLYGTDKGPSFIDYDATVQLLEQPESVLIELLNIFK